MDPGTPRVGDSRLQPGDEILSQRAFSEIAGRHIVIEENIDGANTAISFKLKVICRFRAGDIWPRLSGNHYHNPVAESGIMCMINRDIDLIHSRHGYDAA